MKIIILLLMIIAVIPAAYSTSFTNYINVSINITTNGVYSAVNNDVHVFLNTPSNNSYSISQTLDDAGRVEYINSTTFLNGTNVSVYCSNSNFNLTCPTITCPSDTVQIRNESITYMNGILQDTVSSRISSEMVGLQNKMSETMIQQLTPKAEELKRLQSDNLALSKNITDMQVKVALADSQAKDYYQQYLDLDKKYKSEIQTWFWSLIVVLAVFLLHFAYVHSDIFGSMGRKIGGSGQ